MTTQIQTSIHGSRFGLSTDNKLVVQNEDTSAQYAVTPPATEDLTSTMKELNRLDKSRIVHLFDDFLGDLIADEWGALKGSDAEATAPAMLSSTAGTSINGVVRIIGGDDAAATMAVNGAQLVSNYNWRANNGGLSMEVRVKLASITNLAFFVGFTDSLSLEMPINSASSADTITTTATDAVGFMFDTAMSTDNWWLVGVANNVDATAQNAGVAPTGNTNYILRVDITAAGVATFYIDGVQVGTAMTGAITPTVSLTPTVAVFSRTTATKTIDVDYVQCEMLRS